MNLSNDDQRCTGYHIDWSQDERDTQECDKKRQCTRWLQGKKGGERTPIGYGNRREGACTMWIKAE